MIAVKQCDRASLEYLDDVVSGNLHSSMSSQPLKRPKSMQRWNKKKSQRENSSRMNRTAVRERESIGWWSVSSGLTGPPQFDGRVLDVEEWREEYWGTTRAGHDVVDKLMRHYSTWRIFLTHVCEHTIFWSCCNMRHLNGRCGSWSTQCVWKEEMLGEWTWRRSSTAAKLRVPTKLGTPSNRGKVGTMFMLGNP